MKAFVAKSSDLGPSATNPAGLWSPHYLTLKLALDNNENPDIVLQALQDWLTRQGVAPWKVDKILDLPDMNSAYEALVSLIGAKLNAQHLPEQVQQTLRRALSRLAQKYADKGEKNLDAERQRLNVIRTKFAEGASPRAVVALVLDQ